MLAERGAVERTGPVAGLDFSMDAAHAAWWRAGVPAVCGMLSQAPFAPGSCAAVTMFHVLEHLYDPASYLRAAHDLLGAGRASDRPGAQRRLLAIPAAGRALERASTCPRHLTDFRASDLDRLLESCGFEVLRHKHFSLRDNPAGLATSLAPKLDPMARRVRQVAETPRQRLWKDLLYTALVAASAPFTLLEAVCRAGSTIIWSEARKKS